MRSKKYLWPGLILSFLGALHGVISFIYFTWLNSVSPDVWPAERASLWSYGSFGFVVVTFSIFIYFSVLLFTKSAEGDGR